MPGTITAGSATSAPTAPATSPSPTASPTSSSNNGQAGAPVTVTQNASYGIPCVY